MWILVIMWTDGTESRRAYATKRLCESVLHSYYIDGFGAMIENYQIFKRRDLYYD